MNVGSDGLNAPDDIQGLPYLEFVGIQARIRTQRSWRTMRPEYGVELAEYVDRQDERAAASAEIQGAISEVDERGVVLPRVEVGQ